MSSASSGLGGLFRRRLAVLVVRKFLDKLGDRAADSREVRGIERTTIEIGLGELEALERDVVVVGGEGPFVEILLGLVDDLGGIVGQHALVKHLRR